MRTRWAGPLSRSGKLRLWPAAAMLTAAAAVLVVPSQPGAAYVDDPAPGHTGGFGEPTCQACHFGEPLNDPAGALRVQGIPARTAPGTACRLTIVLRHPGLTRGGFQLSARFADGEHAGESAGSLDTPDERSRVSRHEETGVAYAHHSAPGTLAKHPDTLRWELDWTAPATLSGRIVFHATANASNDDDSPFGDVIYSATAQTLVQATRAAEASRR